MSRSLNRRSFLRSLTAAVVALLAAAGVPPLEQQARAQQTGGGKKPNFLFILSDDWGWGDLGCYGHGQLKTPNLDRLAAQGTLFTQFYVANPVCSPSRAAFMTGQFPARLGIHTALGSPQNNARRGMPNLLDPQAPTVTRLLREAGYATAHFGKLHLIAKGSTPAAYGIGTYRTDQFKSADVKTQGPANWHAADARPRSSEIIVDETIRFIEANRDRPFYVNVWLHDTHGTLHPTPEQLAVYKHLKGPGDLESPQQIYYAAATNADKQIGRLLQRLNELGLADNTVVVFSSDNGPEEEIGNARHSASGSAGPFRGRKRSLYEGGVRVPFVVRGPGVPANRVSDAVVAGVDWLPTLCALAGARVPESVASRLDGEDRSGVLRGSDSPRTKPLLWEYRYHIFGHVWNKSPELAMREGNWKLLMNPDKSRVELYHIGRDPGEADNVAVQNPAVVEAMSRRLLAWAATLPPGPRDPSAGKANYPWPKAQPRTPGTAARSSLQPAANGPSR